MLTQSNPEAAERLLRLAQADVNARWEAHEGMAHRENGNGHR
jgi:hypothetical protein